MAVLYRKEKRGLGLYIAFVVMLAIAAGILCGGILNPLLPSARPDVVFPTIIVLSVVVSISIARRRVRYLEITDSHLYAQGVLAIDFVAFEDCVEIRSHHMTHIVVDTKSKRFLFERDLLDSQSRKILADKGIEYGFKVERFL